MIEPLEALRLATQESAVAVGAEKNLGTLEPGKLADLVLLDKNPLEDMLKALKLRQGQATATAAELLKAIQQFSRETT